jgi:hypothetical protein
VAILSAPEDADAASVMARADATGRTRREKLITANPFLEHFAVADLKRRAHRKMRDPEERAPRPSGARAAQEFDQRRSPFEPATGADFAPGYPVILEARRLPPSRAAIRSTPQRFCSRLRVPLLGFRARFGRCSRALQFRPTPPDSSNPACPRALGARRAGLFGFTRSSSTAIGSSARQMTRPLVAGASLKPPSANREHRAMANEKGLGLAACNWFMPS